MNINDKVIFTVGPNTGQVAKILSIEETVPVMVFVDLGGKKKFVPMTSLEKLLQI